MNSILQPFNYAVLIGCLLGAGLGNKAMYWIDSPQLWVFQGGMQQFFLGGQSMVGGLVGGYIGVELAKHCVGLRTSTGDAFVFPILLGLIIGRVGCFLAGLQDATYGLPTNLPWAVDFGDGVPRHPTQLYEIALTLCLWRYLRGVRPQLTHAPGLLFKIFMATYLLWRLVVDLLKPVPYAYALGLSGIQWVCVITLVFYAPLLIRQWRQSRIVPA
ncbi:MAG: prolipoprotein diacylglyceryl transferase family protein [Gammaproteobacteria bacterium]